MKALKVGLLGIGTVGSGVFTVLTRNQEEIMRRTGRGIEISMVADQQGLPRWWVMQCKS
jgi:homoserine dehydrogenase